MKKQAFLQESPRTCPSPISSHPITGSHPIAGSYKNVKQPVTSEEEVSEGYSKNPIKLSFLNKEPVTFETILKQHSKLSVLTILFHLITFGVYSKLTKGTFKFWKSPEEILFNGIDEIMAHLPEPNSVQKIIQSLPDQPQSAPEMQLTTQPSPVTQELSVPTSQHTSPVQPSATVLPPSKPSQQKCELDIDFPSDTTMKTMQDAIRASFIEHLHAEEQSIRVKCILKTSRYDTPLLQEVGANLADQNYYFIILYSSPDVNIERHRQAICQTCKLDEQYQHRFLVLPFTTDYVYSIDGTSIKRSFDAKGWDKIISDAINQNMPASHFGLN